MIKLLNHYVISRNCIKSARFYCNQNTYKWPDKIVSGVQPTGVLHLGNYFGAIRNWVKLQDTHTNVSYFIADMHSITLPQDPKQLKENILQMTATLLACGINPDRSTLFLQSMVKQHAELAWILGCLTTIAKLSHLPQYKEKLGKEKEIPLGLFVYPVLQAADILIYKATHVPTGDDQKQQLQLAQHLANIFNYKFGETFPICHGIIANDDSSRIRSLRDPTKKMSKSDADIRSRIMLLDSPEIILEKVKKALTDFTSAVSYEPNQRPGVANLLTIHSLFSGIAIDEICAQNTHIDTGKYKLLVADTIINHINPVRLKINDYMKHPEYLIQILNKGADKSRSIAECTIDEVKNKVGLCAYSIKEKEKLDLKTQSIIFK